MKRWLLVATPALVISVLGIGFVVLTDRDPEPLPPSATLSSPVATATTAPATGPSGVSGPTGESGPEESATGPTKSEEPTEEPSLEDKEGEASDDNDGSGTVDPSVSPPADTPTVTLELLISKGSTDPQTFDVAVGTMVILVVASDGVTDRVVVGDGVLSAKVSPTKDAKLTFSVDEPAEVRISLDDAGTIVAKILVT